jgi:hypothetical protein
VPKYDRVVYLSLKYADSLSSALSYWGAFPVSPMEVYSDIFKLDDSPELSIQSFNKESRNFVGNPIILGQFNGKVRRRILFKDTFYETLCEFQQAEWAITNGLTYYGKANTANAQCKIYALIFDLDGTDPDRLWNFLRTASFEMEGGYPNPQYVVESGSNVHLYYVFEEPYSLYPNTKVQLKQLKYALTERIWNTVTSSIKKKQYQGINQGFRVIGGRTKKGGITKAWKLNSHPCCFSELNRYVAAENRIDEQDFWKPHKYTLEQAKVKFPAWYESVVVHGNNLNGCWQCKEDLYNWWLRKPLLAEPGHRYFYCMSAAIYAAKCGIYDKERVRSDLVSFLDIFNSHEADEFTEADIDSALDCLDARYCTFPRYEIEKLTGISIPSNRRNHRSQALHLAGARAIQKVNDEFEGTTWRNKEGRPIGSKNSPKLHNKILAYKRNHPKATQRQIATALGCSPATVCSHLKSRRKKK